MPRSSIAFAAVLLALAVGAPEARAQTTAAAAQAAQATPGARTAPSAQEAPARPRRERSEAQRRNDQVMRDCGAEWRAGKDAMQAQGKTWRTFLPECRARRRA